jgi:hypothetical protein
MLRSLLDRLELSYREEFGVRLDQLAEKDEIMTSARLAASWYQHAPERYRTVCIYRYLHTDLDRLLRKKALHLLDTRRQAG